jgi:hypothetical protein
MKQLDRSRPHSSMTFAKYHPDNPAFEQDGDYFRSDGSYLGPTPGKKQGLQAAAAAAAAPSEVTHTRIGAPSRKGTLSRAQELLESREQAAKPALVPAPPVNPAAEAIRENMRAEAAEAGADDA